MTGWHDEAKCRGPGVTVGRSGASFGVVSFTRNDYWPLNTVLFATDFHGNDERFIYYLLKTIDFSGYNTGSAQPSLNRNHLRHISVRVPVPPEQRAIAGVLGALDDKIEQNRRTSAALERLARAVFRAWFVDFEPVKAKAAGAAGFPSMPQPVFDALPTGIVDSELGPVPDGWEVKPLPAIFDINPPRQLRKGELAPYLEMKDMPTAGHAPDDWIERAAGSGMRFKNGDTLVARITPCLENGKTALVDFLNNGQIGWGSTEYIVLRPNEPLPPIFAYCLARTNEFRDYAIQNMTGTSGRQRVAPTALDHYRIAAPSATVAMVFGGIVQPLFDLIRSNMNESRKLAALRDYLLPKLLSGVVRVREAERAVAEAV
ncbi:MAG TPA: restriction endonuclease subunit S [Gemmataceae bacterium]|nr:restriction endonuclease subunit S [Gemmataceae bacterium]